MKRALLLFCVLIASTRLDAQITWERVVAEVDYVGNGMGTFTRRDSLRYNYSNFRSSMFNYNSTENGVIFKFGINYIDYSLAIGMSYDFQRMELKPNTIDSASVPHVYFDSLRTYAADSAHSLKLISTQAATYNTDGSFHSLIAGIVDTSGAISPVEREVLVYDLGRIIKAYDLMYYGGKWDTVRIRSAAYNSAGNLTLDSTASSSGPGLFKMLSRNIYTYDAAGNYLTKTEVDTDILGMDTAYTVNTYYPNGQLATRAFSASDVMYPGLRLVRKDSFTYIRGLPGYVNRYQDNYDVSGNYSYSIQWILNKLTPDHHRDSVTASLYDRNTPGAITPQQSYKFSYNSNGNPILLKTYVFDPVTGPYLNGFTRWYYEPVLSVPDVYSNSHISLSPNPTSSTLTLDYSTAIPKERLNVVIANAAGQLVHSESFIPVGGKTDILLGTEAAPGLYTITIYCAGNAVLYKGTFLKQ
jgi:hypothetical protein